MEKQKRSGITVITAEILQDRNLTPAEKLVYARIAYFEEFFEESKKTAEYLGIKEWTVQSAKRRLEKLGYIKCICNSGRGKRYVCDLEAGRRAKNNIRPCENQSQSLVKTKSDLGNTKVRPCENQDIGKNEVRMREELSNPKGLGEIAEIVEEKKETYGNPEINKLMDEWEKVFGYRQKETPANRRAAYNLSRSKDYRDKIPQILLMLDHAQRDRYSSREIKQIVGFADLQRNIQHLMVWARREASEQAERNRSIEI